MKTNEKVIVIEPAIKSDISLKHLKNLIVDRLYSNGNSEIESIIYEGNYIVIRLKKTLDLVVAMDFLGNCSGISYIFIAECVSNSFDDVSQTTIKAGKISIYENERFHLIVKSAHKNQNGISSYFLKDLEFSIQSELSSISPSIKYTDNELEANKCLFVLVGRKTAYISILLKRGNDEIPFNLFSQSVVCPVYNTLSILSLVSIIDNGFFPLPVIFYRSKKKLIRILKIFERVMKTYPFNDLQINLVDLGQAITNNNEINDMLKSNGRSNNNKTSSMIKDEIVLLILANLDSSTSFVSIPFSPFVHPFWFFKKNLVSLCQNAKIPLTPLLFKNGFRDTGTLLNKTNTKVPFDNKLPNLSFTYYGVDRQKYEIFSKEVIDRIKPSLEKIVTHNLNMREDDVLDILDTI